jgi:hypothetical protein
MWAYLWAICWREDRIQNDKEDLLFREVFTLNHDLPISRSAKIVTSTSYLSIVLYFLG